MLINQDLASIKKDGEYIHHEYGKFNKPDYHNHQTIAIHPIVSTAFGTCQIRRIKSENGIIIPDYLWFEEYDQVNVLAQLKDSGKFFLFRQKKYGYLGDSLAPIGGLVNPNEDPLDAAKRELNEEAGLLSNEFIHLGKYRVSSTRGGGWLSCFFARDAYSVSKNGERLKSDDLEKQTVVYINSKEELQKAVLNQEFKEAKWTQTIALALLWLDTNRSK